MRRVQMTGMLSALALAGAANAATVNVQLLSQLAGHNPDGPGGGVPVAGAGRSWR